MFIIIVNYFTKPILFHGHMLVLLLQLDFQLLVQLGEFLSPGHHYWEHLLKHLEFEVKTLSVLFFAKQLLFMV